ncbi:MAG: hypothetical protein RLZZ227_167 [Pseudomonadota bacterium]
MPSYWSNKDERKYKHIKQGELDKGRSGDRAEEIAARTVNKARNVEGRTRNTRSMGTGNPTTPLESHTRNELYNRARELNITGRSTMNKTELAAAIGRH